MGNGGTRPVEVLREHVTTLEAALVVCMSDQKPKPIHTLRTESRRVDALLFLLDQLQDLPPFRTQVVKARKHLRKLRKAAGRVRDLDVQCELLESQARKREASEESKAMAAMRKRRREEAVDHLLKQIQKRHAKLAEALGALLKALRPAMQREVPVTMLLDIAEKRFRQSSGLKVHDPTVDQLHELRKAAKIARYLSESAPASRKAKQIAKQYELLQKTGGDWHDWMELTNDAKEELGRHHDLVDHFDRKRNRHLWKFNSLLNSFRET